MTLPNDLTSKLYKLKLAQVEVDTKYRQLTAEEPARLEAILKEETDNYLAMKELLDNKTKDRDTMRKSLLKDNRESKFYQEKINEIGIDKLELRLKELKNETIRKINAKREELKRVNKALEEFGDLEPTNEALKRKIDDLKKSRLSLEMTFVDEQSQP